MMFSPRSFTIENTGMLNMAEELVPSVEILIPIEAEKKQRVPLSEGQLLEVWKRDEYHGKGGSYDCDPFTGKRTPKEV